MNCNEPEVLMTVLQELYATGEDRRQHYNSMIIECGLMTNEHEFRKWTGTLDNLILYLEESLEYGRPLYAIERYLMDSVYENEADLIDADKSGIIESDPVYFYSTRGFVYACSLVLELIEDTKIALAASKEATL